MPKSKSSVPSLLMAMIMLVLVTGCSVISNAFEAQAALDRGYAFAIDGDLDSALAEFERAIELAPGFAPAYDARGTVFLEKGQLERAIADYDKAIELDPDIAMFYGERGVAYLRSGKADLAIADFEMAVELDDDSEITALAYRNLGEVYVLNGQDARAAESFREVLRISADPYLKEVAEGFLESLDAAP